jgi:hypothetical protein
MIFDRILMAIEILLLIRILWQGEYIVHFEREVYKLQSAREKERREWRLSKQKAIIKKLEAPVVLEEKKNGGQ